jgi:uncharacterized membrane protein
MFMKMSEELKRIEQMFRDKVPIKEIHNVVARLREIAEAEEEEKTHSVTPEEERILEVLNGSSDCVKQDDIARKLGIDVPKVKWMLGGLSEKGYIMSGGPDGDPDSYTIEQKGRNVLYSASA